MRNPFLYLLFSCLMLWSCREFNNALEPSENYYANPIMASTAEPWAIRVGDDYYYTQNMEDRIVLWKTSDLTDLASGESKVIWTPSDPERSQHLWAPEIHFIDNKWYLYYTADDGNTDNHHLYVLENTAKDPMQGDFQFKGKLQTDSLDSWAIHPNVFSHRGKLYLLWSGWEQRRVSAETQCIYIAQMENPWTISSERVKISSPDLEWERQWINPDGTRTAYPIFVNEAPQMLPSPAGDKLFVIYSASGNWTPYYALGLLWADADKDLLQAENWSKSSEPVFAMDSLQSVYSVGSFCPIAGKQGDYNYFLFQGRAIPNDPPGSPVNSKALHMQKLEFDEQGFPKLGKPLGNGVTIPKPE